MDRYLIFKPKNNNSTIQASENTHTNKENEKPMEGNEESSGSSIDSPTPNHAEKKRSKKEPKSIPMKRFAAVRLGRYANSTDLALASTSSSANSGNKGDNNENKRNIEHEGRSLSVYSSKMADATDTDTDTDTSHCDEPSEAIKKKKWYPQKFKEEWKKNYRWLEVQTQAGKPTSFCKACVKVIRGGKAQLDRHERTKSHISNHVEVERTPAINTYFSDDQYQKSKNREKLIKSSEMKMTMFLHEHNLPFLLMDHLPKLIASVCPDSEVAKAMKCSRTKAKHLTDCIAAEQITKLSEKLNVNIFSLIIDETTDIGTKKCLAIVARFYDSSIRQSRDHFLGLVHVTSCTAEFLFNAITEYLGSISVPIENMLGFAADNAAVMMGNIRGVQARFRQVLPHMFVLGCVCHSFHLCSSAAAKRLPKSVEELVRSIYNYFSHSSNRQEKLKEFQVFVELKPHKLLHPSQTRWLSVQAAVDRVLENWEALILFFTNECFEDNLCVNQTILSQLKSPAFKIYFTFLSYILDTVNRLNIEFQAEKPKLHLLLNRVRGLYRNILRNYIKKDYLDNVQLQSVEPNNPRNFIPIENIYFGAKTELLLKSENIDPKDIDNFRTHALSFYVVLSEQIKNRFDFNDPTLLFVSLFNPKTACQGDVSSITTDALKLFPTLVGDIDKLNNEWRLLPDISELHAFKDESMEVFWTKIFDMSNELDEPMFPNLSKLVKGILCLPHSSAAAERVFSQLNLIKNKTRNRLHVETCESILHAKELLSKANTCHTWEPSSSLLKRKPQYD